MRINIACFLILLLSVSSGFARHSDNIAFVHDGKTVNGIFTKPDGEGKFPVIIINPGSGPNDRDGTIPMLGGNIACLYPQLLNDTIRSYEDLADDLVDSGYAVLRYDKLEYNYPTTLGTITFHKLWLPVESAINYAKTRNDVDTNQIILIGHSEGSALIPFIAKSRTDIRALISIAGGVTPFDSLLTYQLVNIAQTCGGDVPTAQMQANQIHAYFNLIRTNTWNSNTPAFAGVSASVWHDYVLATDPVIDNYNLNQIPTLFLGMGLDINVPPAELIRFKNAVTTTNDFWSLPGLIHYMTPNNDPHVSAAVADTIVYWLHQKGIATGVNDNYPANNSIQISPNPVESSVKITYRNNEGISGSLSIRNLIGELIYTENINNFSENYSKTIDLSSQPSGIYFIDLNFGADRIIKKIIKK